MKDKELFHGVYMVILGVEFLYRFSSGSPAISNKKTWLIIEFSETDPFLMTRRLEGYSVVFASVRLLRYLLRTG